MKGTFVERPKKKPEDYQKKKKQAPPPKYDVCLIWFRIFILTRFAYIRAVTAAKLTSAKSLTNKKFHLISITTPRVKKFTKTSLETKIVTDESWVGDGISDRAEVILICRLFQTQGIAEESALSPTVGKCVGLIGVDFLTKSIRMSLQKLDGCHQLNIVEQHSEDSLRCLA